RPPRSTSTRKDGPRAPGWSETFTTRPTTRSTPATLTHALLGLRRRRRLLPHDDRNCRDDDRGADQDPPRHVLAAEHHAEHDRDDRVHERVRRHHSERRPCEQPRVRRVADDGAEQDEIRPRE